MILENDDLVYNIALQFISGIGVIKQRMIISYLGSAHQVFSATKADLEAIPTIGPFGAKQILNSRTNAMKRAENELKFIERYRINVYTIDQEDYPKRLSQCVDAPLVIYSKGEVNLNSDKMLSVVGTRKSTAYGSRCCDQLIHNLKVAGHEVVIVSGLAYGIDAISHRAALKNNLPTIGIVGHGLDMIYPASHTDLAREIINNGGAIISDFCSESIMDPSNFVRRNRIIAGLSQGTLVVESAPKGGSLITAELALNYNREVMAVPGRIDDKLSSGCNDLIQKSGAALVRSAEDIVSLLKWEDHMGNFRQAQLFVELDETEQAIAQALSGQDTFTIDELCRQTVIPVYKLSSKLMSMEFKGVVETLPGNSFRLINSSVLK